MEKEHFVGMIKKYIKDNLIAGYCMEMVKFIILMDKLLREYGIMDKI